MPARGRAPFLALVLIVGLAAGLLISSLVSLRDQAAHNADDIDRVEAANRVLAAQLEAEGVEPAAPPADGDAQIVPIPGPAGDDGDTGRPGRDCNPLLWPVCIGPQGEPGEPGASPPAPDDGRDGTDGSDGADGRPPTGQEIAAGVAAFCADGRCQGPQGPPGAAGPAGATGAQGPPGPAPSSFSFTWLAATWSCADPDGDGAYTCQPS